MKAGLESTHRVAASIANSKPQLATAGPVLYFASQDQQSTSGQGSTEGSSSTQEKDVKLTTWEYGKTRDPGLGPYFVMLLFLVPFLLILAPFLPIGIN